MHITIIGVNKIRINAFTKTSAHVLELYTPNEKHLYKQRETISVG